jgi:CO dehydrogenase maturation factor
MAKVIAVTGKGGTGKTMLSAVMIRLLSSEAGARVLAIDADSAISLSYALGMEVGKTLSEIRTEMIEDPVVRKGVMDSHVRTVIAGIVGHGTGFDLLVMGRSEGPGCYCGINDLLRYGIESLSGEYDVIVVDGEAGPEQINRRVLQSIDTLIILTDTSIRGFQTAGVIDGIAGTGGATRLGQKGLVINRMKDGSEAVNDAARKLGLKVFGHIPEDKSITEYDLAGKPIIDIPGTSPGVEAVREILKEIEV